MLLRECDSHEKQILDASASGTTGGLQPPLEATPILHRTAGSVKWRRTGPLVGED